MVIDEFLDKIEEWVDRSEGQDPRRRGARQAAGAWASPARNARPAGRSALCAEAWRAGHRRVFRPWMPEPGLWLQFDWGDGPRSPADPPLLFCAWLAWSRFRVVLPTWDRTLPTLLGCLDATLRRSGGAPTYALTDNEKTVTVEHIARVPVRHPDVVAAGRLLRDDDPHLCSGRSAIQGRRGGDGADRQGRSGADRGEPARRSTARSPSSRPACAGVLRAR